MMYRLHQGSPQWEVFKELAEGRLSPALAADITGYSVDFCGDTLRQLVGEGYARKPVQGIYEITDEGLDKAGIDMDAWKGALITVERGEYLETTTIETECPECGSTLSHGFSDGSEVESLTCTDCEIEWQLSLAQTIE